MWSRVMKQERAAWIGWEEHRKMTLEALTDVEAGRGIDHEIVQAWADTLSASNCRGLAVALSSSGDHYMVTAKGGWRHYSKASA